MKALLPLLLGLAACGGGPRLIVLNGTNEDLNAYDPLDGDAKQVVYSGNNLEADPTVPALNGEICFDPLHDNRIVMGDDAGQPNPPPGWALLELSGDRVGKLSLKRLTHLYPTYQTGAAGAENYGCGFLKDGRLLTADLGNQETGPSNGQLTIWFPPLDVEKPKYCKLDLALGTPGGVYVDAEDQIYVASQRNETGVWRYKGPFPTGDDAAHGCGKLDNLGSPLADSVTRERFITGSAEVPTPSAIVAGGRGFYVSSVLNGVIAEYDQNGQFLRVLLSPPTGETLGDKPFSTGTPVGIGTDDRGSIYVADLGLTDKDGSIDVGDHTGTVRRLRIAGGAAVALEKIDQGLNFPDGIGVWQR